MRFNKQHLIKLGLLGLASLSLAACNLGQGGNNSSNNTTNATVTEVDKKVEISDNTNIAGMSESEKASFYSSLDQITLDTSEGLKPGEYSNIKEIITEQEYNDLILSTTDGPKIVYLGFDECPYCHAFSPKINQLAKEKGVTVYYYNTRKHANDSNFQSAMQVYGVNKVPNAFIVKSGKPGTNVNHSSKMADLEAFINEAAK
ncbi:thioredoxin family protein [Abiotrophia defectiva]